MHARYFCIRSTEVDVRCDKLTCIVNRTLTVASFVNLVCVHLCSTTLTRRSDNRRAAAKFSTFRVWNKLSDESTLIYRDIQIYSDTL